MAWGLPMQFNAIAKNGEVTRIIMRPYRMDENIILADGISRHEVIRYIGSDTAKTPEQETEWLKEKIEEKDSVVWAICVAENKKDQIGRPIGTSSISYIKNLRGVSGCVIFDTNMWGKGIASACHKARCYYAEHVMGLHAIDSYVAFPNHGSRKALLNAGYFVTGVCFGTFFANGNWHNCHSLIWINPAYEAEFPQIEQLASQRKKSAKNTKLALKWAKHNITFM